ncbi:MAG: DUF1499 domain-containing protein [bacterium]
MTRTMGWVGVMALAMNTMACAGRAPEGLGVREGRLAPCPSSPNCVSSDASDPGHAIEPLAVRGGMEPAWEGLRVLLQEKDRVRITQEEPDYLHAVFTTRIMRYRDDVEFHARPDRGEIAVRSASRVGYGDMGANRKRIESIRAELVQRGLVHPKED